MDRQPPKVELKAQLIEKKYVDQKKLVRALSSRFSEPNGTRNFKIQLRLNRYTIMVPETLTEREINEFCLV